MTSTHADLEAGRSLVRAALVPYERKLSDRDTAALTAQLLRLGEELLPSVARLRPKSESALSNWDQLITDGESGGPLGTWTYARGLARVLRMMMDLLEQDAAR